MQKFLSALKPGESGRVVAVNGEGRIRRRLFDMGVTPGAEISIKKVAPLGDPLDVTLRVYEITLLKSEAAFVATE